MARHRTDPASHLAQLKVKEAKLKREIAGKARKLRKDSRVRLARQSRIVGEAIFRLAERGQISEELRRQVIAELAPHLNKRDREDLAGTFFEVAPEVEANARTAEFGLLAQAKRRRSDSDR